MTVHTPDITALTVGAGVPAGWVLTESTGSTGTTVVEVKSVTTPVGDRAISVDPANTAYRLLSYTAAATSAGTGASLDVLVCTRRLGTVTGRDGGIMARVDVPSTLYGRLATIAQNELHAAKILGDVFSHHTNSPFAAAQPAVGTWWWLRAQFEGDTIRTSWSTDLADLAAVDAAGTPAIGWQIVGTSPTSGNEGDDVGLYVRAEDEVQYAYFSAGTNGDLAAEPTIGGGNTAPVVDAGSDDTAYAGQAFTHAVSATDADGDPLTLTCSALPAGLTFTDNGDGTGVVSGTATTPATAVTVTITADDGTTTGTDSFELTVGLATPAVTIDSETNPTTTGGTDGTVTVSAPQVTGEVYRRIEKDVGTGWVVIEEDADPTLPYTVTGLSAGTGTIGMVAKTTAGPGTATVNLFVDTDYDGDVDDLMAHGQMFGHVYLGEAQILGMVANGRCTWVPLAIERMNVWHGYPSIPVGMWQGNGGIYDAASQTNQCGSSGWSGYDAFAEDVATTYPGTLTAGTIPDALEVYRDTLAAQPDNSVTVLLLGYHTTIYDFLNSPANWNGDGLPSGADLANAKVKEFVVAGTRDGGAANHNFTQVPDYTEWLMNNVGDGLTVDKPFIVMPNNNSEPGGDMTAMQVGSNVTAQPTDQIVRYAMRQFILDTTNFENGHFAWDLMGTLAAVRGAAYGWTSVAGTFSWGGTREVWTPGSGGPHIRLENNQTPDPQWYIDRIDPLIFHSQAV